MGIARKVADREEKESERLASTTPWTVEPGLACHDLLLAAICTCLKPNQALRLYRMIREEAVSSHWSGQMRF